jgi:hypothetical protein
LSEFFHETRDCDSPALQSRNGPIEGGAIW